MYLWQGDGSRHFPGVPMTDLSAEEMAAYAEQFPDYHLTASDLWKQEGGRATKPAPVAEKGGLDAGGGAVLEPAPGRRDSGPVAAGR